MNSLPPSTPFPVAGLNHEKEDQFVQFLRSLNKEYLDENLPRIPALDKDKWIAIVDGLSDVCLSTFPLPDSNTTWDATQQKIEAVDATLDVSKRVFRRVDCIYNSSEELVKKLLVRVVDICGALDLWIEADVPCGEQVLSPTQLKEKAVDVVASILRGFGDYIPLASDGQKPSWHILREMLRDCLDICNEVLLTSLPLTSRTWVAFFNKPRIINLNDQDPVTTEPEGPLYVRLPQPGRIPLFLVLLLDIMVKAISPRLKSQWHLLDITRSVAEFSRNLLFQCLGPVFSTRATIRSKVFMAALFITKQLRQEPEHRHIIGDLIEYSLHKSSNQNLGQVLRF
ncbi:hypothetical protein CPB84DRAFT_80766 [Gymnopilus junonius]|uniref:Uncharacterized protein n=1 Tax=Gymnopilus junonius TaxID=109634 RepID=A0A9P5P3L6_GYMJU|nr:hypothetical protein CPB84DRAFT_80766 [Gymnopilus junonius]